MAAIDTTTTTTTTTSTRTGQQLVVDSQANTVSIGNVVTDVSLQPYIAPRTVGFYAYNLRPNHRVHIFFDSINVDQYCAPCDIPTSIADSSDPDSLTKNGNWGDTIMTDENGQVAGHFAIPAGMFRTGERILEITNVDNLSTGTDAIVTRASASFVASNLSVTKENITLTTINAELSYMPVSETVVSQNTSVTVTRRPDIVDINAQWFEPIAQSLTINTPGGDAGVFATSLDLWFKQKSLVSNNGVTVYVCETENGYPKGSVILPFSTVHLNEGDVVTSEDAAANAYTRFVFESPVFLANKTEYAFIVKPDANDPDYFVYSANLGDVDLTTGIQVFQQPAVGTAFYGATMTQWTALQTEYIKFRLNIANFQNPTGNATFQNANTDYLQIYNVGFANSTLGIMPGDYVYNATNSTANTCNTSISGRVSYYDTLKGVLYVDKSSGNFPANSYIQVHRFANASLAASPNTVTQVGYANTGSLYNPILDALVGQFATITPPGTALSYQFKGTSNAYGVDSDEFKIQAGYETEFYDQERIVASKSNEVANMSGNKSFRMRLGLSTDTGLLSPVIDLVRRQQLVIANQIGPVEFDYNEFFTSGDSPSKYVSRIVTLADGQDAQDLQVILTAFRPPSSDVQVWVRFLNGEDGEPITQKPWAMLINSGGGMYSDPSNPSDMREFVYTVPKFWGLIPTTGSITTANSSANVSGNSTLFGTDVEPGWYIGMRANTTFSEKLRRITSITNTTFMTTDSPFLGNYTNQPYFIVPPPTAPYLSANTKTRITGNVATSTTTNIITGTGTAFNTELREGSILNIAQDNQTVVSITNSTSLTVGTPWSSAVSSANAYLVTPQGLTYLSASGGSLYNTFKRFQVKIVLQSNDTSKVPIIDDLRCLALQL